MNARDFDRMRLAAAGDKPRLHEILQMEMRRKHASKLHDTLTCADFEFPDSLSGEQATADDIAEIHLSLIDSGDEVLDMTCGLGIDAFHLARKASSVTACEMKSALVEAARRNASALGLNNMEIVEGDSVRWLSESDRKFDTIFIDPARRSISGGRLYALSDCQPDVTAILPLLRERSRRLVVKASPMLDVSRTIEEMGGDADIMLCGTPTECKELVAIVPGNGTITAVTTGGIKFSFKRDDELSAIPASSCPYAGETLYEPYPAVMKSGGLKLLSTRFNLAKAAPDTHLYSGDADVAFPGQRYGVDAVEHFDKRGIKSVKQLAAGQAEVAVRNFGMTAEDLRKRIGVIRESGPMRVYGMRDSEGNRMLVVTHRI